MTEIILRQSLKTTAIGVLCGTLLCWLLLGEGEGLGALIGGVVAGADFLALIHLVGRLLDPTVPSAGKMRLVLLIGAKLAIVGSVLYLAVTRLPVGHLGVVLGVGAAIGGFTLGVSRASRSPEAEAAMKEQERQIRQEMDDEGDDFE